MGDTVAWASMWNALTGWYDPKPALPAIDFDSSQVVLAIVGGGAVVDVRLDSIVTFAEGRAVYITGCNGYSALQIGGWAAELVRIPRGAAVQFRTRMRDDC